MLGQLAKGLLLTAGLLSTAAFSADIEGEWFSGCQEIEAPLPNGKTQKAYITDYWMFQADGSFIQEAGTYLDRKCNKLFLLSTLEGTYATGLTGEIDLTVDSNAFTFTSAMKPALALFNKTKFCGISDWKVDTLIDVTGRTCEIDLLGMKESFDTASQGDMLYNIYDVKNGELMMGEMTDDLDGTTIDKRPTELSTEVIYTAL